MNEPTVQALYLILCPARQGSKLSSSDMSSSVVKTLDEYERRIASSHANSGPPLLVLSNQDMQMQLRTCCQVANLPHDHKPGTKQGDDSPAIRKRIQDMIVQVRQALGETPGPYTKKAKRGTSDESLAALRLKGSMQLVAGWTHNKDTCSDPVSYSCQAFYENQVRPNSKQSYMAAATLTLGGGPLTRTSQTGPPTTWPALPGQGIRYTWEDRYAHHRNEPLQQEALAVIVGFGPQYGSNGEGLLVLYFYTRQQFEAAGFACRTILTGTCDNPRQTTLDELFAIHPAAPKAVPGILVSGVGQVRIFPGQHHILLPCASLQNVCLLTVRVWGLGPYYLLTPLCVRCLQVNHDMVSDMADIKPFAGMDAASDDKSTCFFKFVLDPKGFQRAGFVGECFLALPVEPDIQAVHRQVSNVGWSLQAPTYLLTFVLQPLCDKLGQLYDNNIQEGQDVDAAVPFSAFCSLASHAVGMTDDEDHPVQVSYLVTGPKWEVRVPSYACLKELMNRLGCTKFPDLPPNDKTQKACIITYNLGKANQVYARLDR